VYALLEEQFLLTEPTVPTANLEPYYPGWNHVHFNAVAGERPAPNDARDNYFGRAQAWGSVLSGGLAGHLYGTGAYCGNTVGEQAGSRPFIWEALLYPSGKQVAWVRKFMLSEGAAYLELQPASHDLHPRTASTSQPNGLDGWGFMMRTADKELAMLYFENASELPEIAGLRPESVYHLNWSHPTKGEWREAIERETDRRGVMRLRGFPTQGKISMSDWALKIKAN
jgi:hypothetical protein